MNPFFIIFLGIPALEIFLLIKIGGNIGALNTVALIFLTAIIGVYFAKLQGISTLKSGMLNLYQNKMPIYEIMSGASIAIAALLLIPFTRKILFNLALRKKSVSEKENQEKTIEGEIVDKKKDEL